MLTRIRIETFNHDLGDVERELDEFEAAVLGHELRAVGALRPGQSAAAIIFAEEQQSAEWVEVEEQPGDDRDHADRLAGDDSAAEEIKAAMKLFDRLGEGAITRHLTEQTIRASEDGDGWVARRVVRYDGGVYSDDRAAQLRDHAEDAARA